LRKLLRIWAGKWVSRQNKLAEGDWKENEAESGKKAKVNKEKTQDQEVLWGFYLQRPSECPSPAAHHSSSIPPRA
jgi:hypothetical protein